MVLITRSLIFTVIHQYINNIYTGLISICIINILVNSTCAIFFFLFFTVQRIFCFVIDTILYVHLL